MCAHFISALTSNVQILLHSEFMRYEMCFSIVKLKINIEQNGINSLFLVKICFTLKVY